MDEHIKWLNAYIDRKCEETDDPGPMELKRLHTFKVLENARRITDAEFSLAEPARAALLAALYHDIARFDQYLLHATFRDAQSFNHGLKGVQILKREGRFREENKETARLALCAVGLHNRREIPAILAPQCRKACAVVRDADKLDILRVIEEHLRDKPYNPTVILSLPDDPDLANPAVSRAAMNGQCASYGDLRSVNDFRVLLGSWFFALNFPVSREIFLSGGHGLRLVEALPDNRRYKEVKDRLLRAFGENKKDG